MRSRHVQYRMFSYNFIVDWKTFWERVFSVIIHKWFRRSLSKPRVSCSTILEVPDLRIKNLKKFHNIWIKYNSCWFWYWNFNNVDSLWTFDTKYFKQRCITGNLKLGTGNGNFSFFIAILCYSKVTLRLLVFKAGEFLNFQIFWNFG